MKKWFAMLLTAILAISLAACGNTSGSNDTVTFADAGWDSIKFHNEVAIFIAEHAYGLKGEQTSGTTAITYSAMKSGDIDVYMEVWTDNLATYKDDVSSGEFQELSVNFDDNAQGFYVPRYVIEGDAERGIEASAPDLVTVADLAKYSDLFTDPDDPSKGRIYGAISGWEVDTVMRNKVSYYGLDKYYNYIDPGSEAALAASISAAYEKGEPIVAYYWEPTWITGKYDLVLLQDAPYNPDTYLNGECACPSVRVTVCVSNDFAQAQPEYCEFLSNYQTSSALTAEALSYMQENDASYEDTVTWFLSKHDELLNEWLPADKADLVRDALH
ncbi:MAG: glycine betaine ABC transporter substrate-binding protein [Anaerofustis sp.]